MYRKISLVCKQRIKQYQRSSRRVVCKKRVQQSTEDVEGRIKEGETYIRNQISSILLHYIILL